MNRIKIVFTSGGSTVYKIPEWETNEVANYFKRYIGQFLDDVVVYKGRKV